MKSINVHTRKNDKAPYTISFGDGTLHTFKNLKQAKRFEVRTNQFLTDLLYNYNELYSNLFALYRLTWAFFYNTKTTNKANHFQEEQAIKESLQAIDDLLEKLTTSTSRQESYYYVFHDFKVINKEIQTIIFEISNAVQNKSICIFDHKIRILSESNQININQLENYSKLDLKHKITSDPLAATFKYLSITKTA